MRTFKTATAALLALMAMACNNNPTPPAIDRTVEDTDSVTGVITLRNYVINDTVTVAGRLYNYTCTFEPVDTMPVVINPQGLEYKESRVRIDIQQGENKVFSKTFYKSNFHEFVPADVLKSSTMVGVNYNVIKGEEDHTAFYFIVTVGDPDETSDMSYPLELKVATDGTFSLKKAENLETEPISTGLNIDPGEDGTI